MDFAELLRDFRSEDLVWVVPVLAGLVIIVGALLAGIVRGMTSGVVVAIFFGGLLSTAPTIVTLLQPPENRLAEASAAVAESTAELSERNYRIATELVRAVTTLRRAVAEIPVPSARDDGEAGGDGDDGAAGRVAQSVADVETRLDAAIAAIDDAATARMALGDRLQALKVEMRRLELEERRALQ